MSERRVVYGMGPVSELIRSRSSEIDCLFVSDKRVAKGGSDPVAMLISDARNRGLRYSEVDQSELDRLCEQGLHQGIAAITGAFAYKELHELVDGAGQPGLLVALDGITDPHNLGAILRSALLLGAHGVILPKDRAAKVTPIVTKASAGASEHIPVAQVTNLVRALEELREHEYWSAGIASGPKAQPLTTIDASMPLVLVLGSEGKGIRPLVAKACDFHLEIPMAASAVGSFNVSVAAAIALYEVARQRQSS